MFAKISAPQHQPPEKDAAGMGWAQAFDSQQSLQGFPRLGTQVTLGESLVYISANLCLRLFSDPFSPVLGGGPRLFISHLTKLQCILCTSAVQ